MIVLSVIALLLALVAVVFFAGQGSARPSEPVSPRGTPDPLDPTGSFSPLWLPIVGATSEPQPSDHHHHHSGDSSLPTDTGGFDAGSHSHH